MAQASANTVITVSKNIVELGDEGISDIYVLDKMNTKSIMLCEKINKFIQIFLF